MNKQMCKWTLYCLVFIVATCSPGQKLNAQELQPEVVLINYQEPAWKLVKRWIDSAANPVQVLACDTAKTKVVLYQTQLTTRSPMGAIVYQTGGILVDSGWIRILGGGSKKMKRTLPGWNAGKTVNRKGEIPGFYLIADDAVGGFFALNGGALGADTNHVYYLSPDALQWQPLEFTYSEFLQFCFSGDLATFYGTLRWQKWMQDAAALSPDKVFSFMPYLWSAEGKDINNNIRRVIPVAEQYFFNVNARRQLQLNN